jgi:hypothetical protein
MSKMLNMSTDPKKHATALLLTALLFWVPQAFAQTNTGHVPDILGLTLSMSREQAISYLKANFAASEPREITEAIGSRDYMSSQLPVSYVTYIVRNTPTSEQLEKQAAAFYSPSGSEWTPAGIDFDEIKISVSPVNSNEILAIKRRSSFRESDQPLLMVFQQSVVAKYGPPVDNAAVGQPGTQWSALWSGTPKPRVMGEFSGFQRNLAYYQCSALGDSVADLDRNFSYAID